MITLSKDGTDLVDSTGQPADAVAFTVAWMAKTPKGRMAKLKGAIKVDLDLTVICFDADIRPVAVCNQDSTHPFGEYALVHTGDTKSGRGGGEQHETVLAVLSHIPPQMHALAVVLNSYEGHNFEAVNQLRMTIDERRSDGSLAEIATTYLPIQGNQNAALMGVVRRGPDGGWMVASRDYIFEGGADWLAIANRAAAHIR